MNSYIFKLMLALLSVCSYEAFSLEYSAKSQTEAEIIYLLHKWPGDFNAGNVEAVCGLFGRDLVASYPGTPDRNYDEMCRHLRAVLTDPNKKFHYNEPQIEQILLQGDMAVVRLIWTLKISDKGQTEPHIIREKGLDVFKRNQGTWKIAISYAYPEQG